jgi:hypothetical protein
MVVAAVFLYPLFVHYLYTWIEPFNPEKLSQAKLADTERALQTEQNTRIEEQQRYEQHGMALGDSDFLKCMGNEQAEMGI